MEILFLGRKGWFCEHCKDSLMSKAEFEKLLGGEQPHRIEHRCTRMTTQARDYRRSSVYHDQEEFRLEQT